MRIFRQRGAIVGAIIILIVLGFVILFQLSETPVIRGKVLDSTQEFQGICIDGVEYIYLELSAGPSLLAPHFKPDGALYLCGDAGEQGDR